MTPTASSELISPGCILNKFTEQSLCAMQDCVVIDCDKKQLQQLCMLLRWKSFGIGASNRSLSLSFVLTPRQSLLEGHRFPRLFGTAGLRERPHGSPSDRVGLSLLGVTRSPAHVVLSGVDAMGQPIADEEQRTRDVRVVPYNWAESFRFGGGSMGLEVLAAIRVQVAQGAGRVAAEGLLPLDQVFAKLDKEGYLRHVVHVKNEAGEQGVGRGSGC